MANAMEVLGDNKIIDKVFEGYLLKIYPYDDEVANIIKLYIIRAHINALKFEAGYKLWVERYNIDYMKWCKHGNKKDKEPKLKYWTMFKTKDMVELKVNHLRQKYWYWKKIIE